LFTANDLCLLKSDDLSLYSWRSDDSSDPDAGTISAAMKSLSKTPVGKFLGQLADVLAAFDWRSSAAPGLSSEEVTVRKTLRGSGGYREMRRLLLEHVAKSSGNLGVSAKSALKLLRLA
jgi:hypothetical protein